VVRVGANPGEDLRGIAALGLRARDGRIVPLGDVTELRTEQGPAQISRQHGSRKICVEMNVRGRDTVRFVEHAKKALESTMKLPPNYQVHWGG
jgi:cobalt-zinc-cadmium resistance protein CzcA